VSTWEDVRRIATGLPGVSERDARTLAWRVADRGLVWERPLRPADLAALGLAAQDEPVLGVRTSDESVKLALIAEDSQIFFTTPHFDGYPAVLIWLDRISPARLAEVITEAWLDRAPKRFTREFLARGTSPAP
jgi:hypothetical protein